MVLLHMHDGTLVMEEKLVYLYGVSHLSEVPSHRTGLVSFDNRDEPPPYIAHSDTYSLDLCNDCMSREG
jgi:hypothetical protein